jgi:DNA-directed RNA polymerase subunit beta
MTLFDVNVEGMTPQKLINPKALSAVIRDFFGRSQLSHASARSKRRKARTSA